MIEPKHSARIKVREGNELIVKFMGSDDYICYCATLNKNYIKYHISWDWLMPVVEKINQIGGYDVHIYKTTCIIDGPFEMGKFYYVSENLIECVWITVVKFIEWYNQNN